MNISAGLLPETSNTLYVGSPWAANANIEVNVKGGSLKEFVAQSGTVVNLSAGALTGSVLAGSTFNMSGGSSTWRLSVASGGSTNISGGTLRHFEPQPYSYVTFSGNEFRKNGLPLDSSSFGVPLTTLLKPLDVLTGVLADGTPFFYSFPNNGTPAGQSPYFTLIPTSLPTYSPGQIVVSSASSLAGARSGQLLRVVSGGKLGVFFAGWGSEVVVEEGSEVGFYFGALGSRVTIHGGEIGSEFALFDESVATITGGEFSSDLLAERGSRATVTGGRFRGGLQSRRGSKTSISGGAFGYVASGRQGPTSIDGDVAISGGTFYGPNFLVSGGGNVVMSGGAIEGDFMASAGSRVEFRGTDFRLDDVPIAGLLMGQPLVVPERGAYLSGRLKDGSPFRFFMDGSPVPEYERLIHRVSPDAQIVVMLVPEPGTAPLMAAAVAVCAAQRRRRRALSALASRRAN